MNQAVAILLVVVALILGGLWGGYELGQASRNDEVAVLAADLRAETSRADDQVATLVSLRDTLRQERLRHALLRQAADDELAARATRIADLTLAASKRQTEFKKKAAADEDCAPLRDLPVCAAVAERLWGGPATDRPH